MHASFFTLWFPHEITHIKDYHKVPLSSIIFKRCSVLDISTASKTGQLTLKTNLERQIAPQASGKSVNVIFEVNRPFKLHQIDLLDNILLKESLIIFLLARSLSLVHTCCQIIHLHTHIPLIPVLDSGNGTGTKLILHLPLLPLAFHLPHFSSSLTYSLKRMYLVPNTCSGKKHSLTGHLSTDWNSSNQPLQGGENMTPNPSLGPIPAPDSKIRSF